MRIIETRGLKTRQEVFAGLDAPCYAPFAPIIGGIKKKGVQKMATVRKNFDSYKFWYYSGVATEDHEPVGEEEQ
jgi:hypothetical protein